MPLQTPFRLKPLLMPRIWGRRDLSPWFNNETGEVVGEAWLTGPDSVVMDGPFAGMTLAALCAAEPLMLLGDKAAEKEFPVLLKLLFPDDWLSVQVHPNDEQAAKKNSKGKTECWYVLDAEPEATVALGFEDADVTTEQVRDAIAEKDLEPLLHYERVQAGDMVFVDANTVHAIGPGVTIFEIQQTSDITYRLYDYGRPRELHLEEGLAVMKTRTRAGKVEPTGHSGMTTLIREQYFTVERFELSAGESVEVTVSNSIPQVFAVLEGEVEVRCGDFEALKAGIAETVIVPPAIDTSVITAESNAVFCLVHP